MKIIVVLIQELVFGGQTSPRILQILVMKIIVVLVSIIYLRFQFPSLPSPKKKKKPPFFHQYYIQGVTFLEDKEYF